LRKYGYATEENIQLNNGHFPASITDPKEIVKKALRFDFLQQFFLFKKC